MTYCNAGHNPPIWIDRGGEVSPLPLTHDLVLAAMEDKQYHEKEIILNPGDSLFLYTDGVTEANNLAGELYGDNRLLENCKTYTGLSPREIVSSITHSVSTFAMGAVQSDDITLLAIRYNG